MKTAISQCLAMVLFVTYAGPASGVTQAAPPQESAIEASDMSLEFLHGKWIGTAKGIARDGQPYEITQTERVGPMLEGKVTVIEGRGFNADGSLTFNAFAIVSRDKRTGKWEIRSYTGGNVGTFAFEPKTNGFIWTIPLGAGAVQRFTTTIKDDIWTEVGEYIPAQGPVRQTIEMKLRRVGSTDWPSAGYVTPSGE